MARDERRFELRPVDEEAEKHRIIARIGRMGLMRPKEKPIRLHVPLIETKRNQRLANRSSDDYEPRDRQPGIEALIEVNIGTPNQLEENWGTQSASQRPIPFGWFILVGLLLSGGVIWSLTRVTESDDKVHEIRIAAENVLIDDEREDQEAVRLIDAIQMTTRQFFRATTIDSLLKFVRQPDRVRPLMEIHYASHPVAMHRLREFRMLQPLTLDNHGNYWMASVELDNREKRNLLLEILPSGEARIDWEMLVCYQPMKWDDFATKKPREVSMDFRVYVQQDHFFSHEFADSNRWNSFRLTALDSDETLFGYVQSGSALSQEIIAQLQRNPRHRASMILRLVIPEGIQSHSGVVVKKLMSPRWLYMDPPEP